MPLKLLEPSVVEQPSSPIAPKISWREKLIEKSTVVQPRCLQSSTLVETPNKPPSLPDNQPFPRLASFLSWLESQPPADWDYSRWDPYCRLVAFDPREFWHHTPMVKLLEQTDSQVSTYFGLPEKERYELFNKLPPNTTVNEFIAAGRELIRKLSGDTKTQA